MARLGLPALSFAVLAFGCSSPQSPPTPAPTASATPAAASVAPSSEDASASPPVTSVEPPETPLAAASGETDPQAALAAARKEGKPAFVVFCAKWVAACGELAHVLVDPGVKKTLDERFVVARVDVSNDDDALTKERMKRYNVKGLPCMIVFDRKGKEVARESVYLDATRLSKLLERAK